MDNKKTYTEKVNVDFYKVDAGWLYFNVKVGEQLFNGVFSEVLDPVLNFKKWLETIAIGAQQVSFEFDPEGSIIRFTFEEVAKNREILTIYEPYEDKGEVFIKANVNRKQVVKEFYTSLINFSKSDKYKPKEWEIEYIKERLYKLLKVNENELIHQMLELNKDELKKLLFQADPSYMVSFSDTKGIQKGAPEEWNVPQDYDFYTIEKKKKYIIDCLNESTEGYCGMKLSEFQSNLIERYL